MDVERLTYGFPPPQVYQKNPYSDDDDSSFGQDSYMSSCAQSYGSFDNNDDSDDEHISAPTPRFNSYATALASTTTRGSNTPRTQAPTPPSRLPQDVNVNVAAYTPEMAQLQSEVTIGNLQAEIKLLRAQLLDAQTPSTVTATSQPVSNEQDRMASIEASMSAMSSQFATWMTEVRHIARPPSSSSQGTKYSQEFTAEPPNSQQSKRADTRQMPDRPQPMQITNPPPGIQLFTHPISPPLLATQPSATTPPPTGYDPQHPDYLYLDNGDDSLFCVGRAGPADYKSDGIPKGLHPSPHQHKYSNSIQRAHNPPPSSPPSTSYRSPSSAQQSPVSMTGSFSPASLPVEGAHTER